ncbi:MAG: DUF1565 domain-containing protein [bacterium]|nr:DUF1565 domain-containing protein [bacterium]
MNFSALLVVPLIAPLASADDWYVDAVNGDNSNGGTAATDAWRTITYALEQIGPGAGDTLHLLPGVYDAAHGEVFPFVPQGQLTVTGDGGREVTILSSPADAFSIGTESGSVDLTVTDVTIVDSADAFDILVASVGDVTLTVSDVVIRGCNYGVDMYAHELFGFHCVDLTRVEIVDGNRGVDVANSDWNMIDLELVDCTFKNLTAGVYVEAGLDCDNSTTIDRCRILGCTGGVSSIAWMPGTASVAVRNSVIAGGSVGVYVETGSVLRCTIANNSNTGVGFWTQRWVRESIVYGNGTDLGANVTATDCNVGDMLPPGAGNISVDPLFRDPEHHDYRLGFHTGCVDAIPTSNGPDLTGFERGNDGDLNHHGAGDMGALELRTLAAPQAVGIGKKLAIEVHADPGDFTVLWLARSLQLPTPVATPFGDRWLPEPLLELVATHKVQTSDPVLHTVYVPDLPILIGQPFSFQALSRSSAAFSGAGWTDAVTVMVTP